MENKQIHMKPGKFTWRSEPSGQELKHVLTITAPMTTEERAEVEELVCQFWNFNVIISGESKPEPLPLPMFDEMPKNTDNGDLPE